MFSLPVVVVLAVLAYIGFRYLEGRSLPVTLAQIDPNSPEMQDAISNALATLPIFWERRASALNPSDYSLKIRMEADGKAESIWLSDPQMEGDKVSGIVDQSPAFLSLKEGERIACEASQIRDWMYIESDSIHGNFTGRVTGKPQNMSKRQYEAILASFAPLPVVSEQAVNINPNSQPL